MFTSTWALNLFAWNLLPRWVSNGVEAFCFFFSTLLKPVVTSRDGDRKLIAEALSGDSGFEKLVKTYERMVYRVAFRFLNDETDSGDVTQEVFLRVHRSLAKFRGESSLSTWIYAITANLSRNAIRSKRNREKTQVLAPREKDGETISFWDKAVDRKSVSSFRSMESGELKGAIQKALTELPPDYRKAVILRDLEGLDYGEISEILKTGLGTVKSRIARGRALLRDKLRDWL